MVVDPAIVTEPFEHQRRVYEHARDLPYFALFWEMGLGKTKTLIDVASHLWFSGKIRAMLVVASKSVYPNWISQEIPPHMAAPHVDLSYQTYASKTAKGELMGQYFLDERFFNDQLRVVCMSYDQICLDRGKSFAMSLLVKFPSMMIVDESTAIANGRTDRARSVKEVGLFAKHRWIATGTPAAEGPFKLHSQIEFLDDRFWANMGCHSYEAFKTNFSIRRLDKQNMRIRGQMVTRKFWTVEGYKDLDRLGGAIAPISSRLLKEDSEVKLPPKMYQTREFEMTEEQRRVYDQVRLRFLADLDSGVTIDAKLAITRIMRLEQITCGFVKAKRLVPFDMGFMLDPDDPVPMDEEESLIDLMPIDENPRLQLLRDALEEAMPAHKVIVWSRFTRGIEHIMQMLGPTIAVRYDGKTKEKDRELALHRFRNDDECRVFVANQSAISEGVTLVQAKTMIYYSNSPRLHLRLQSEDRIHRIGQDASVLYIDPVAKNSCNGKMIASLRKKYDIAASVMGDRFREWLTNE